MKVLLKRFHLNGHTIGFDPQTQKLRSETVNRTVSRLSSSFCFNVHFVSLFAMEVF